MPNVGHENQPSYTAVTAGVATVGTTAAALPATAGGLVYLKAAAGNAGTITLGGSGVTDGAGWTLAAGEASPPLVLSTLTAMYAVADQSGQELEYLVQS